jgi:hypothetical protein
VYFTEQQNGIIRSVGDDKITENAAVLVVRWAGLPAAGGW